MIFATIGNEHKSFFRFNELVLKIADLFPEEDIIYQKGYTKFVHSKENISDKEFFSRKEFDYYIKNASHVMTHGGAGTLLQLAKIKKMPYVLPRLYKYKEHVNSHQMETLIQFKKLGLAIEIDYPFKDKFLLEIIKFKKDIKINENNVSTFDENSLIESIKKDVEDFLR